eukprot:12913544-Prorocentrum_lima.AAC.1
MHTHKRSQHAHACWRKATPPSATKCARWCRAGRYQVNSRRPEATLAVSAPAPIQLCIAVRPQLPGGALQA